VLFEGVDWLTVDCFEGLPVLEAGQEVCFSGGWEGDVVCLNQAISGTCYRLPLSVEDNEVFDVL